MSHASARDVFFHHTSENSEYSPRRYSPPTKLFPRVPPPKPRGGKGPYAHLPENQLRSIAPYTVSTQHPRSRPVSESGTVLLRASRPTICSLASKAVPGQRYVQSWSVGNTYGSKLEHNYNTHQLNPCRIARIGVDPYGVYEGTLGMKHRSYSPMQHKAAYSSQQRQKQDECEMIEALTFSEVDTMKIFAKQRRGL